jgi:hypothetical protein
VSPIFNRPGWIPITGLCWDVPGTTKSSLTSLYVTAACKMSAYLRVSRRLGDVLSLFVFFQVAVVLTKVGSVLVVIRLIERRSIQR